MCVCVCAHARYGGVSVEEEEREKKKENSAAFQGSGFRLGDEEGPSQVVGKQNPLLPKPEMVINVGVLEKDPPLMIVRKWLCQIILFR